MCPIISRGKKSEPLMTSIPTLKLSCNRAGNLYLPDTQARALKYEATEFEALELVNCEVHSDIRAMPSTLQLRVANVCKAPLFPTEYQANLFAMYALA